MGNCVGGFKRRTTKISPWSKSFKNIVICFLGTDSAGKTTIVKALQGENLNNALPTIGFSRVELSVKKQELIIYDLGGSDKIRDIWSTYYAEAYGFVYVIDSAATNQIDENKILINSLKEQPNVVGKPFLFLLNKKDLPEAIDELRFSEMFELHEMAKQNKADIRVERICAVKGTGKDIDIVIVDSIYWLFEQIKANYVNIDKTVSEALKKLQNRQAQDRLERQHRLAQLNS